MPAIQKNLPEDIDQFLGRLFPICRSITGEGVRETLSIVREHIPIKIHEVPSGTKAFDWTVPKEWNIKDAYIKGPSGEKVVDFKENNLHVMSYSTAINTKMPLSELKKNLHSLPEQPDLIPYKTSYYQENWGFCLSDSDLKKLPDGEYEVFIDSTLKDGSLRYGEIYIGGKTKKEILISCYVCHPSMANDNLSGIALATFLAKEIKARGGNYYSYRFLFTPETIGAIVWLSKNKRATKNIKHGFVATCCGDNGPFTYKKSREGGMEIDQMVSKILANTKSKYKIVDFFPYGSDERQYCSPGFNLPIGSLMRTMYYNFPEYHTSGDNLSFVKGVYLEETLSMYKKILDALEKNKTYKNTSPFGEPQLGKRGLYASTGGPRPTEESRQAIAWVLNLSDGKHSLLDIAECSGKTFEVIAEATRKLLSHKLLSEVS